MNRIIRKLLYAELVVSGLFPAIGWAVPYCDVVTVDEGTYLQQYYGTYDAACYAHGGLYDDDLPDGLSQLGTESQIVYLSDNLHLANDQCDSILSWSSVFYQNTSCSAGYRLVSTLSMFDCDRAGSVQQGSGKVCVQCTSTRSYGSWGDYNTQYQRRTVSYAWNESGCGTVPSSYYEYRCAAGYYSEAGLDSATSTSSLKCTKCASATQSYTTAAKTTLKAGTSAVGSTAATSCYIDKNTTLYDEKGTFKTPASNCYYSTTATTNLL